MKIRKVVSLVIPIVLMFQLTTHASTEPGTENLLQEQKVLGAQFDLDRMIAYVVTDRLEFMVLDIRTPEKPALLALLNLDASETITGVQIRDCFVYVTAGRRLQVIDVTDPYHPSASYYTYVETGESLTGLVICGTMAYLYDRHNIHVYSLENPALPEFLKSYELNGPDPACSISGIAVRDGMVYAALGDEGIHIFDFTNLNDIRYSGNLNDAWGPCKNIVSSGELIFVFVPEANIVQVFNVSDSKKPKTIGVIRDFCSPQPEGPIGFTGTPVCFGIK